VFVKIKAIENRKGLSMAKNVVVVDRKFIIVMFLVCLAIGAGFAFIYSELDARFNVLESDYATLQAQMNQLTGLVGSLHQSNVKNLTAVQIYNRTSDSVVLVSCTLSNGSIVEGSGFVYSLYLNGSGGYIITNNHVVEDTTSQSVTFYNGTSVPATVIGTDVYSDLAVVRVNSLPKQVQPLILGNSTQLMVGEPVYAIGNPFGLSGTMTAGIVSQVGRVITLSDLGVPPPYGNYQMVDLIQTDAAINPGNSGSPLLDNLGLVVGMTFAIQTAGGVNGFIGVGYAIPSMLIYRVIRSLISNGSYSHPYMGIGYNPNYVGGLLITSVNNTGPAHNAGLQPGDIITKVDSLTVSRAEDLIVYLELYKSPGDVIQLTVVRNNNFSSPLNISLTLGARPR
jgi:S1-C subfamily serine protease